MNKRMKELKELIDPKKIYDLDEAIDLAIKTSKVNFDASVELHARLGIDPRKGEQQIRSTVVLPHGTGKTKKIAAFVGPNHEKEAKEAGADFIYDEQDIKTIKDSEKVDFDIAVASPEMMPKIAKIAKILGPRGLMPSPKTETVGPNVKEMIEALRKGKCAFKNDKTSNIHQIVGKVSFGPEKLKENILTFTSALKKTRPVSAKGKFVKSFFITTSMGPSIKTQFPES